MHPNEKTLRDGSAAMARGDGRLIAQMLDPAAGWHIPGSSPLAGTYRGLDAVVGGGKRVAGRGSRCSMCSRTTHAVWSSWSGAARAGA